MHTLDPCPETHQLSCSLTADVGFQPPHPPPDQVPESYCRHGAPSMSSGITSLSPKNPLYQPEDLIINIHAWHPVGN